MRTEDALRLLGEHQAGILAQCDLSRRLLGTSPDHARDGLAKARWSLIRLLRAYQLFKHTEIFDPVIARGNAIQVATARRLKADCIAAGQQYAAHVARWSARDVVGQWDQYRGATLAIVDDLRQHLARERIDVARLLDGADRTRRPARLMP